jgi:hypothetical protein
MQANKAEHAAETRAARQLPEDNKTGIRAAASSPHYAEPGGGPDGVGGLVRGILTRHGLTS